jgi:hypothetical protein
MVHACTAMISKSTKIAIDVSILDRIEAIKPSYQTKKSYINMLLDEAVQRLEIKHKHDASEQQATGGLQPV